MCLGLSSLICYNQPMHTILNVYKPTAQTPLQMIERVRESLPEYKDARISYAGRLDPLAHGVLLLLVDEAIQEREVFLNLEKSYTFTVLWGVRTDSYDFLGIPQSKYVSPPSNVNSIASSFVNDRTGIFYQEYPPFSSRTVQGKPLFQWAKEKRLKDIAIPSKKVSVSDFSVENTSEIDISELQDKIQSTVPVIKGDFRQEEIQKLWDQYIHTFSNKTLLTTTFSITCSSGTYVRGLAHEMGEKVGCGAIAIDIKRTRVGKYTIEDSVRL
jgi:tRNA pseudouridine55 synthase